MEQQTEPRGKVQWSREEDGRLRDYVIKNGARCWNAMAHNLNMGRTGNSCRLRWVNYLSRKIRREKFTVQEVLTILKLHHRFGNKWARIAQQLPRRTDNDVKNFWNTRMKKEARRLKCDVASNEFRHMMKARLTGRLQASAFTTPADPGGTPVASFLTRSPIHVVDRPADDEELMSDHHTLNVEQDSNSDEFWARFNADQDCCTNQEYWARLGSFFF